jgi:hypothetical protein
VFDEVKPVFLVFLRVFLVTAAQQIPPGQQRHEETPRESSRTTNWLIDFAILGVFIFEEKGQNS